MAGHIALDLVEADEGSAVRSIDDLNMWLARHRIRSVLPEGAYQPMRELLSAVRDVLEAAACNRQPSTQAINAVNSASADAPTAPQLSWPADDAPTVWHTTPSTSERHVQGLIAHSAIELASLQGKDRLRMCESESCGRLFVTSNPRRRWCSSAICGNRERVRRHTARRRATGSDTGPLGSAPEAGAAPP
jgi:predicted RNA-binding Zn ribbon-like protein